jgi:hypothetical protein
MCGADRTGRRTLLLRSMIGVVLGLFLLGGTFYLIAGVEKAHDTCEAYVHCSTCVASSGCGWCAPLEGAGFCLSGNKTNPFTRTSFPLFPAVSLKNSQLCVLVRGDQISVSVAIGSSMLVAAVLPVDGWLCFRWFCTSPSLALDLEQVSAECWRRER